MDMDFNDVFGGPPRRFSIQESRTRYSFSDPMESEEDSAGSSHNSRTGFSEKPVFGAENVSRRRNGGDFYDDIFNVDGSYSSPKRNDRDTFGSNPGSRVLSPVRALSPNTEPFGTSLPAQFSLPAKLTKATDLPLFASGSHSTHKKKDASSQGTSTSSSRFSEKEMNSAPSFYRQSPLSREVSTIGDELKNMSESDEQHIGRNMKKNGASVEVLSNDDQFHFSIYKWAGKGVAIVMPLRRGKYFKSKEEVTTERVSDISSPLGENLKISRDADFHSFSTPSKNQERSGNTYGIAGEIRGIPKSKSLQNVKDAAAVDGTKLATKREAEEPQFRQKTDLVEGIQIEIPRNSEKIANDGFKPLRAFLVNEDKEQGDAKMAQETEGKNDTVKAMQAAQSNVKVNKNMKRTDDGVDKNLKKRDAEVSNNMQKTDSEAKRKGKKKTIIDTKVDRGSPQGSPLRSTEKSTKAGMKGKVQDFVKMFNHEVHSTPQESVSRSKSFRWKASRNIEAESEKSFSTPKANEEVQLPTINKMQDAAHNVNQNHNKQEETTKFSQMKTPTPQTKGYSDQKADPSINESKRDDRKASVGSLDDLFGGNYVVEELLEDHGEASETTGKSEDIQVSDAKIRQWSQGRKGNIRSLLSTLQLVLWPESGWKPVALVNLIEASAVKRSYQRALLYLHPDKLQQKGAAAHQKYIAEKVFDILQEAWDHFNSVGSI